MTTSAEALAMLREICSAYTSADSGRDLRLLEAINSAQTLLLDSERRDESPSEDMHMDYARESRNRR